MPNTVAFGSVHLKETGQNMLSMTMVLKKVSFS